MNKIVKQSLLGFLLLAGIASMQGQTITPGSATYCDSRADKLYCLLPRLFAEANPDPFTPVTSAFATQLTQLPLASPASGVIYAFAPRIGVPERVGQETFGPVLTERGDTMGYHRAFAAFTFQRFTFSSLDGIGLGQLPIVFNVCAAASGQCAPIGTTDSVRLRVNQYAFFGTFGLFSRVDVSVAIPINRVSEGAAALSCNPCLGPVVNPGATPVQQYSFQTASAAGVRSGIGDLVLRAKATVLKRDHYKLAAGTDVRVPTGDALNFLGSGAPGVRPFAALSRGGRFSPHANLAFQWNGNSILGSQTSGSSGKLANDFFYSAGMDGSLAHKITAAVDYLGDYVDNQFRLKRISTQTSPGITVPDVDVTRGSFNTAKGSIGLKYNPVTNLLITGNLLVRFDHNGLRNNPVPLAGISYTF